MGLGLGEDGRSGANATTLGEDLDGVAWHGFREVRWVQLPANVLQRDFILGDSRRIWLKENFSRHLALNAGFAGREDLYTSNVHSESRVKGQSFDVLFVQVTQTAMPSHYGVPHYGTLFSGRQRNKSVVHFLGDRGSVLRVEVGVFPSREGKV